MDLTAVRAALADTARRARVPGMSLAVVSRDRVLSSGGTGYADLHALTPATAGTVYPWFSMTKPVTATAALRLSDQGLLDLQAPVHEYLDWLRAPGPVQPTVWQLLTHSSGLGNPLPVKWIHPAGCAGAGPGGDAAETDGPAPSVPLPGRRQGHYSNVGYLVAAQIISQVSGEPFTSYVQREILGPLGMDSTGFSYPPGRPAATGYVRIPRPIAPVLAGVLPPGTLGSRHGDYSSINPFLVDGAGYGGLVGTVLDAAAFARLHLNDGLAALPGTAAGPLASAGSEGPGLRGLRTPEGRRILQESTARAMRDIHVKGKQFDHSAGWFRKHTNGPQGSYVEHFGTGLGFWNIMRLYPERGRGIVIMSNSTTSYDYATLFSLILRIPWTSGKPEEAWHHPGLLLFDQGRFHVDLDLVADQQPAGFEGGVPRQPELLAADFGLGAESRPGGTKRINRDAAELDFEFHGLGDAADGEVAGDGVVLAVTFDARGPERHLRIVFDVEEVRPAHVAVAVRIAGVEACRFHGGVQAGGRQGRAHMRFRRGVGEPPADFADAGVADREPDFAVGHVEGPDAGGNALGKSHNGSPSTGLAGLDRRFFGVLPS